MAILHDAIKTTQNGVFLFFFKDKKIFLFKKPKTPGLKKTCGLF